MTSMTSGPNDDFESVRADPDPIRRGRRATELLTVYQQRAAELARLRKTAIDQAHRDQGMSYTQIAALIGITKGRITQIRASAPREERAFFGVGPVSVGIPYRYGTTDRERPLVAAEDLQTGEQIERLLAGLAFAVTRYHIDPERENPEDGDSVVICGPKSAPIGAHLLSRDPALTIEEQHGRWWIKNRSTAELLGSPADDDSSETADIAYVARHRLSDRVIVHIAGIHAIGSLGAADYLTSHLADVSHEVGDRSCSFAVRASYEGLHITGSELTAGPYFWETS